jgi:hypothetical protein
MGRLQHQAVIQRRRRIDGSIALCYCKDCLLNNILGGKLFNWNQFKSNKDQLTMTRLSLTCNCWGTCQLTLL